MTEQKINVKVELASNESKALDRFIDTYQTGFEGKSVLIKRCVVGGNILRESGMLDIITNIAEESDYINATTSFERTRIVAERLTAVFGVANQAEQVQTATNEVDAVAKTNEIVEDKQPLPSKSDKRSESLKIDLDSSELGI
ncbi:hypothetical protein [Photobacterium leiognathi]|uniref:hypothetical protein n=1 Tax=Photobacterium leiognathi TaxID=553611 RepID=UPI002980A77C|nr:hypothetical protein [Photobacterium leiognathi]